MTRTHTYPRRLWQPRRQGSGGRGPAAQAEVGKVLER